MEQGGLAVYGIPDVPAILSATADFFDSNTDPKAQIITTLSGAATGTTALVLFFYDGPSRPPIFEPFDQFVPVLTTIQTKTFSSFVSEFQSGLVTNARGTFNTVSTSKLTPNFLAAVRNQTDVSGVFRSTDPPPPPPLLFFLALYRKLMRTPCCSCYVVLRRPHGLPQRHEHQLRRRALPAHVRREGDRQRLSALGFPAPGTFSLSLSLFLHPVQASSLPSSPRNRNHRVPLFAILPVSAPPRMST